MKIGIVGCGPAGLATALLLQRTGHEVTLMERFEEPRAVGSGFILQPTGLAVLAELELSEAVHSFGQRLDRIYGLAGPSGRVVLDINYEALGEGFHGIGVHRAALFDLLFGEVEKHDIAVRTGLEVQAVEHVADGIAVLDDAGRRCGEYDLVIDASGARSRLRQFAVQPSTSRPLEYGAIWGTFEWPGEPFQRNALEQRYVQAHTMIGALPLGRHRGTDRDLVAFFWSLKAASYQAWVDAGLDSWKDDVCEIWPDAEAILRQIESPQQMTLASYSHQTLAMPFAGKLAFIGDAAHSTSPQLGQGANMALLDAWSLAEAIGEVESNNDHDLARQLREYAKSRRWHVRMFQLSSLAMTPFYQSDSRVLAALRDLLFNPVSKLPIARRIVAGLISGMLAGPPRSLDYSSGMERRAETVDRR